jgi:hypothetical protein
MGCHQMNRYGETDTVSSQDTSYVYGQLWIFGLARDVTTKSTR